MEIISMADSITVSTTQGLGFAKFFLHRHYCSSSSSNNHLSLICDSAYESSSSIGVLSITSGISPVDAIAPPIVRPNLYRIVPRSPPRNKRRTRKRSLAGDSEDGEEDGFFGNGDDGTFGNGGGGGSSGGKGWNFDRFGESNWEESSSSSASDPAFDFFYEVISWIALSNCIHFAYKKVVRIVADGIGAPSRQKAPMRLVTMC